jgi:hypothetical protein
VTALLSHSRGRRSGVALAEGMIVVQRVGMISAGILLMMAQASWSADMPSEGAAMPFSIGPSQQKTLPYLRVRDNTCEQISNDFQLTKALTLGTIVPVIRLGAQLGLPNCGAYSYNMMAYMAPPNIPYKMSDQFDYYQVTTDGPITIGGYVTLCSRPPSNPNGACP